MSDQEPKNQTTESTAPTCHQIPSHTNYVNNSCPNCGFCPHCGRGGYQFYPNHYWYPWTYQPYYPTWTWGYNPGTTNYPPNYTG